VLAGRNWAAGEDDGGEAKRLDQLPLQDVLERADHVIEVRLRRLAVRSARAPACIRDDRCWPTRAYLCMPTRS
jgi:hypothetical protein